MELGGFDFEISRATGKPKREDISDVFRASGCIDTDVIPDGCGDTGDVVFNNVWIFNIEALLSYARAGNAPCERRSVDLSDVLGYVRADLETDIATACAVVEHEELPIVSGDPTLLRQLLQNLVGNALKYRDPGRPCRVTVSARWRLRACPSGAAVDT